MGFGRLQRSQGSAPLSDINMTPLIDVMLVLLVIFIITAPLLVSGIRVELPRASGTSASSAPQYVEISIARSGQVFVSDQPQTAESLDTLLQATARANAAAEVRLRADTSVPYGRVVQVMGQAQQAGLSRIGFVADSAQQAKP